MHGTIGQADRHDLDAHLVQQLRHLQSAFGVGAQTGRQHDRARVDPGRVGALKRARAAYGTQDGNAQRSQPPGDEALFAGAHGGRRAPDDGSLGRHEQQVRAKHQVGRRRAVRLDSEHGHAGVTVGLGQGIVLLLRPVEIQCTELLRGVWVGGQPHFRSWAVEQHCLERRPFALDAAGSPQAANLLAEGCGTRRPTGAPIGRRREKIDHCFASYSAHRPAGRLDQVTACRVAG
jgi:hypothetical protein